MPPYINNLYFNSTIILHNRTTTTLKTSANGASAETAATLAWMSLTKQEQKNVTRIEVAKYSLNKLPEGFNNSTHKFPDSITRKLTDPVNFTPSELADLEKNIKSFQRG
jgi:hypothetical protein